MTTVAPDPNIDALKVFIDDRGPFFLHTSPEMGMKKILLHGHKRIFQICKVYRVEEQADIHNTEFTMLEWYREGTYLDAMEEVEELISCVAGMLTIDNREVFARPWKIYELSELFMAMTRINPFGLTRDEFFIHGITWFSGMMKEMHGMTFFKLFIQEAEPKIPGCSYFIMNWPLSVPTMAKRKDENRVEWFELYIAGLK